MITKAIGAILIALLALVTGCGGGSSSSPPAASNGPTASPTPSGKITVLAAASLTESFTQIGKDFSAKYPGTSVTFSFGSSATLADQIAQGAPADVFAAANETTMQKVVDAGEASDAQPFVSNVLEIAVPAGNPGKITGLRDFADPNKRLAVCAPQVPCGAAAEKVFAAAKIGALPDTLERDVKAALQKVELNEVDAALVYRTDVLAAGTKVEGIKFSEAQSAINLYPISPLLSSQNATTASAFVAYVRSPDGQKVLTAAGFGRP
jgi:molybdate transport system substrate-binding protein